MNCKFILRRLYNNSNAPKLILNSRNSFVVKNKDGYLLNFTNIAPNNNCAKNPTQNQNTTTTQTGISTVANITIGNITINSWYSNSTKEIVRLNNGTNNNNNNDPATNRNSLFKMFEVKLYIAYTFNIKPDNLVLYYNENKVINDFDPFPNNNLTVNKVEVGHQHKVNDTLSTIKVTTFNWFYTIETRNVKVIIDTKQRQVDQIIFYLAPSTSMLCIKHYIIEKVPSFSTAKIDTLNWYGDCIYTIEPEHSNDVNKNNNYVINKQRENHWFENNMTLLDVLDHYHIDIKSYLLDANNTKNLIISLLLSQVENNKLSFGLDFRFNFMKNFNKINYADEAPSFREVSDGLNLFFYCCFENCIWYKEMFTKNFGYGQFDVWELSNVTKCPKCDRLKSDLRNIGWINSRWLYKAVIKGSNKSEGDGFTWDYKLYILPEIQITQQFSSLLIVTEPYVVNVSSNYSGTYISDNSEEEDEWSECYQQGNSNIMKVKSNKSESKDRGGKSERSLVKNSKGLKMVTFKENNIKIDDERKSQRSCCYTETNYCAIY